MNLHICTPNEDGPVVQLVRMPPCHGGGRGFESRPDRRNAKAETKKASRNVGLFLFQAVGKESVFSITFYCKEPLAAKNCSPFFGVDITAISDRR